MTERAIAKETVDAAFRMQTTLGPGLLESIYQTVWAYELGRRGPHGKPAAVNGLPKRSRKVAKPPRGAGIHRQRLPGISRGTLDHI